MISRKVTKEIRIGNILIGGSNNIAIQSMCNTKTKDTSSTIEQIKSLEKEGCNIVRVAVLDIEDAIAIKEIKNNINIPIVADIHFDYKLALASIESGIDKLRINPGNIGSIDKIKLVVDKCKEKNIPIRIGVNMGSLDKEIEKEYGRCAKALVYSAKKHVQILEDLEFYDIVISLKASDVLTTIEAYKLASLEFNYPLHIGVTEAGTEFSGSIKSSIGLGTLLYLGIGDTLRVSLSDDPVKEIKVAKEAAISDADGKLANKVNTSDFETFQTNNTAAIATAKSEAIADAAKAVDEAGFAVATEVEATYATKSELTAHVEAAEAAYAKATDVANTYATKSELTAHETAAETAYAKKAEVYTTTEIDNLIKNINQGNQATAGEVSAALESYKTSNDKEIANLKEKDTALTTAVELAQAQADKGVADAAQVAADLVIANLAIADNAREIGVAKSSIDAVNTTLSGKITALENVDTQFTSDIVALQGTVSGHTTTITEHGTKLATLENKDTELAALIQANTNKFADYYTKEELDTTVQEVFDAVNSLEGALEPYAKEEDVDRALALKANAADVYTKTEADAEFMTEAEVDARISALIDAANSEDTIKNVNDLVAYVNENASDIAQLVSDVATNKSAHEKNASDIVAINEALTKIVQPKESAEISVATDGTLGIKELNVNKLVQTEGDTLILNGGDASVKAAE